MCVSVRGHDQTPVGDIQYVNDMFILQCAVIYGLSVLFDHC